MKTQYILNALISLLLIVCCATFVGAQSRTAALFSTTSPTEKRGTSNPKVAYLSLAQAALQQLFGAKPQTLTLDLPYKNETIRLNLVQHRPLANGFCILQQTAHGIDTLPYTAGVYYKGSVVGAQGKSIASISVFNDHIVGTFSDVRGTFTLGATVETQANGTKRNSATDYVLFRTEDVPNPNAIGCFTDNDAPEAHSVATSLTQNRTSVTQDSVRIYLEADYTLYRGLGGTTAEADYITSVFNAVATIYDAEQIALRLAPIMMWTVQDNFDFDSSSKALEDFRALRTTFDGEQAQLLSLNPLGGIAAGFNTFCTDRRYSYSGIDASFDAMPAYSWTVAVVAHEFGHCFGSRHTHWCGWAGGAIDACSGSLEAAPDGTICGTPPTPTVDGGTIMSYCSWNLGTNFANGFGQQPGNRIRACVANRYCLPNSTTGGVAVQLPTGVTTNTTFWSIDGGVWLLKNEVAANLSAGQHTIRFKDIVGYHRPFAQTITVVPQQTTIVNAAYILPSGHIVVNITGGSGQGQWRYSNTDTWHNSGDTVAVPVTVTNLIFKPLLGWNIPILSNFILQDSVKYTFAATYNAIPKGKITVHINGGNSLSKWFVYNDPIIPNTLRNSDDTLTVNAENLYTIGFNTVANWITPQNTAIYATNSQIKTHTATYQAPLLGLVRVNLIGANGNGQWSIYNDTTWYNSGTTASTVQGQAAIFFKDVVGWLKPQYINATITNNISVYTAEYTPTPYATMRVNIVGGDGLGKWKSYYSNVLHNSGDTVRLATNAQGYYFFMATRVSGWLTPNGLQVLPASLNTTQENGFTLNYVHIRKAPLRVNLTGDSGLGQWRINAGAWRNSGDTAMVGMQHDFGNASYISYKTVGGVVTPASVVVPYANLDTILTTTLTGAYMPVIARPVRVFLTGANGNGQWRLSGTNGTLLTWKNSGDTALITNAVSSYLVVYKSVTDWKSPNNPYLNWSSGTGAIVISSAYTPIQYGVVRVNLAGENGAGYWRLYNNSTNKATAWKRSGDTLRRPSAPMTMVSQYSVEFTDVPNKQKPDLYGGLYVTLPPNHTSTYTYHYTNSPAPISSRLVVRFTGSNGQGRWTIDGINLHRSGDTISTVYGQSYPLSFVDVNGWSKPYYNNIWGSNGVNTINSAYIATDYFYLKLYLTGANSQGRWKVNNEVWLNSGDSIQLANNLGNNIQFTTVNGWVSPNYYLSNPILTQNLTDTAHYTPKQYGTVKVNVTGANGLGRWRVRNNFNVYSAWRNTGDSLPIEVAVYHNIEFKDVLNWNLPANVSSSFYVNANQTVTFNPIYTPLTYATLKVITVGDGGAGGWSENNGAITWRNSGDTIRTLSEYGSYVYYKPVDGLITPNFFYATLHPNAQNTVYGEYLPKQYYTFTGNIVGGDGAAQWRINGGVWHNHGDSVRLEAGLSYPIQYKSISNWVTPLAVNVAMNSNVTQTGTYIPLERGILKIKTVGGNAQGGCTVYSTTLYHNDTLHTYVGTTYVIYPTYIPGFNSLYLQTYTPTIGRVMDSITINYTPITYGTLQVNLQGGNGEGAWAIVPYGYNLNSNAYWYNNGDTLTLPTSRAYDIHFRDVAGWTKPAIQSYTQTTANTVIQRMGVYTQTTQNLYTLVVHIAGDNGQGRWTIDGGGTWKNSGDTLHFSMYKIRYIQFSDINGYIKPNYITYNPTITGQITTFTGTYTLAPTAIIQVNITGGNAQGQWRIDNETMWRNSGDTVHFTANTTHYVLFKDVAGFITPNLYSAYLIPNQSMTLQIAYEPIQYATLKVNLTGANGLGKWQISTDTTWHSSGDTLHLPAHLNYYIVCKAVANWTTPNTAIYTPDINSPTTIDLAYQPIPTGLLKINLVGGSNNAKWRLYNEIAWRNSGDTVRLPAQASYTVEYKNTTGWFTPINDNYTVYANQTTTGTGTYTEAGYGILKVNLVGGDAFGQWSSNWGNMWYNSGDTLHLSNAQSSYTIIFKTVNGWVSPNNENYAPILNQITTKTGVYTRPDFGTLQVNLTGANGQGLWSINQINWHTSGDTIHSLVGNNPTLYFAPVAGWIKPTVQSIYINNTQTIATVGNYTQPVGTEINTPTFAAAIMPNPANDYIRCTTSSSDINTPLQISLYNSLGVLLYSSSLSANDEHRISTAAYANGFYIVQIYNPRTKAAVLHKVIIQH